MKHYTLTCTLSGPSEDTEDMYMAEVPALPGCRAWGATPVEVLENLQSVASEFIASYNDHGDELPPAIIAAEAFASSEAEVREVMIAV